MKVKERKNIGVSGYADVRVNKNSLRVGFLDGETFDLDLDQWEEKRPGGKFNITLSRDNTKIFGVRPIAGSYILRFAGFGNRIEDVPEPKIQRGGKRQKKDGGYFYAPDRMVFIPQFAVHAEGKYDGLLVATFLPYVFEPVQGTDLTQINGRRGEITQVENFLSICGFDVMRDEIPYSNNILPWLERYLYAKNEPVMGSINDKGFVADLSVIPNELKKGLK